MLSNFRSQVDVYVVDCDPGQPIFALPGTLSISKVVRPLLANDHQLLASSTLLVETLYFDAVTPSSNMALFMKLS